LKTGFYRSIRPLVVAGLSGMHVALVKAKPEACQDHPGRFTGACSSHPGDYPINASRVGHREHQLTTAYAGEKEKLP
jgi:hypothetical protein